MSYFYIALLAVLLTAKKVESAAYGETCSATNVGDKGDCTDTHGSCSATTGGTCGCAATYVASANKVCLLKAGQTCTADADCTTYSTCLSGTPKTCTCSTNYVAQTATGLCVPKENAYGGSCTITNSVDSCVTPGSDPNAVCSAATGGTCGCKPGYSATVGAKCSGAMTFAGSVFLLVAALILTTYLQ